MVRCAIVEDEPLAQQLLEKYVSRVSSLELTATFDDAIIAFDQLPNLRPDVIFLDINLPEMSGMEFLRAYPLPHPAVVMTTANPAHALDGFEFGVTDYLLKPITFERFLKAVGRVRDKISSHSPAATEPLPLSNPSSATDGKGEFFYFKTDKKLEQIILDDIVFVESLGDYVKVFMADRYFVSLLTMKKLAETLPSDRFLRIHRSCLVQLSHIKMLEGNTVHTSTGHQLILGPNYRDFVKDTLKKRLMN
ncbi:LytTR family DNA-binding domain-containing protein [Dyadobacter sp. 3J3]|uniref:LytR/AlgR family response regulator transcription factor n=1 Tax=Dyadobacter sp. 3J3 TaxID=2606600 RepID=UPI001357D3C9|nr:LytTR family DNA-binding domain-containing protein [Dyadobacter sp. 3J3]